MATITIRNLSEKTRQRLRERAARNGRSMEAEARVMLGDTDAAQDSPATPVAAPLPKEHEALLTENEKKTLSPEAQAALGRLRKIFQPKPGEAIQSAADELIAERRAEAARE